MFICIFYDLHNYVLLSAAVYGVINSDVTIIDKTKKHMQVEHR